MFLSVESGAFVELRFYTNIECSFEGSVGSLALLFAKPQILIDNGLEVRL